MGNTLHTDMRLTEWGESASGGQNRKNKDLGVCEKLNNKKILSVIYLFTTFLLFILPILPAEGGFSPFC